MVRLLSVVATLAVPLFCFGDDAPRRPPVRRHTFSIVVFDPATKSWGVGTASEAIAVGAGTPWAQAGAGAIASQSAANVTYGPRGLKKLADGAGAADVVRWLIADDEDRADRQVGIVDAAGRPAAFTGKTCDPWCGEVFGKHHVCLGNHLHGPEVLQAMSDAYEKAPGTLSLRIMAALDAGEKAGGDRRGKQSAAILIVRKNFGYLGLDDRALDLRVDGHRRPIQKLGRLLVKAAQESDS